MPYLINLTPIPTKAIPYLTIRLNSVVQPVVMPMKEHLIICIKPNPACIDGPSSRPVKPQEHCALDSEPARDPGSNQRLVENGASCIVEQLREVLPENEEEAESGALLDEVDAFCDRDRDESDSEDAPDWMFEEGEE